MSTKKKDEDLTNEEWKEKFAKHLLAVTFKCIEEEEKARGVEFADGLAVSFVAGFTGALIYHILNRQHPDNTKVKKELYNFVSTNYSDIKLKVENAVAAGFTGALSSYSGKQVEYYCQVKVVPEPANTLAC